MAYKHATANFEVKHNYLTGVNISSSLNKTRHVFFLLFFPSPLIIRALSILIYLYSGRDFFVVNVITGNYFGLWRGALTIRSSKLLFNGGPRADRTQERGGGKRRKITYHEN